MQEIMHPSAEHPISQQELGRELDKLLASIGPIRKALILPPDFTRCFSYGGIIARMLYERLSPEAQVNIMPATGTHAPMSREERLRFFGPDIPEKAYLTHDWRGGIVTLGEVPAEFVGSLGEPRFARPVKVQLNHALVEGGYDRIFSVGQVVPHEVVGMSNYSKNIFVGVGGREMINGSHMLSSIYGIERVIGLVDTPTRRLFDYAHERFLKDLPLCFILSVTREHGGEVDLHGLFAGDTRRPFEQAAALSQQLNITHLPRRVHKVVTWLDPNELRTAWVGNKGIYRTRMIVEDGGEVLVLAPGVCRFGESEEMDALIRRYGYRGTDYILDLYNQGVFDGREMAAGHLLHACTDGRFTITYATDPAKLSAQEVEQVGFRHLPLSQALARYNPEKLEDGFNTLPDGEEIYFVRTPAMGLWRADD